jgi:hypothetical protein
MILVSNQESNLHCEPAIPDSCIQQYIDVVRRYCTWAEGFPGEPHDEMIVARRLLSELHFTVISLPEVDLCDDSKSQRLPHEDLRTVHDRFGLLPVAGYWDVFDPLESTEHGPAFGVLADDLTDIYRDLKTCLVLFDEGKTAEALAQWRLNFLTNWGYHLAGAQHVLHSYFANEQPELRSA